MRTRQVLSITSLRKLQTVIGKVSDRGLVRQFSCVLSRQGTVVSSGCLVAIGYMDCDHIKAVSFCIVAVAFMGLHSCGAIISHLDVASNYAGREPLSNLLVSRDCSPLCCGLGTLVGITNSLAAIPGFVGPFVVGVITNKNVRCRLLRTLERLSLYSKPSKRGV